MGILEFIEVVEHGLYQRVNNILRHIGRCYEGRGHSKGWRVAGVAPVQPARNNSLAVIRVIRNQLVDGRSGNRFIRAAVIA